MPRNITLPTAVDLSTASADLYFRTGGSTITYLPTGGWNGGDACEFTPPNMYPPPVQNANQGYSALGNFILVQRPQVLFTRWMFRGSPDYFSLESRWAARAGQKSFVLRRSNGGDGIERVMVVFNGYGPGQFTIAVCNGVDCRFPIPRFPLHEHVQGKWVCFEVEANLQTGMKRLYITTEDGRLRNHLLQEEALAPGPPTDTWNDIDFIGFFAGPIDTSIPGFSFKLSDVAISNQFIGPPPGFGERLRRWYLSRRIGTGVPGTEDSLRCESHDWLHANFLGQENTNSGYVGGAWVWALRPYDLTPAAHTALLAALPNTYALPDMPLTTPLLSIPLATRNDLIAQLDSAGFDMTWTTPANTLGELVNYVISSCQMAEWGNTQIGAKAFDFRRKTMGTITTAHRAEIESRAALYGVNMTGIGSASTLEQVAQRFNAVRLRDGKPPVHEVTVVRN